MDIVKNITINGDKYSSEQIKSVLKNLGFGDSSGEIQKPDGGMRQRGLDPAVVVAIVGATGTMIGALIAGFFQLIGGRKDRKIVLKWPDGRSIEYPANLHPKELDKMINDLKQLEHQEHNEFEIFLY